MKDKKVMERLAELYEYALWKGDFLDFAIGMFTLSMTLFGFMFTLLMLAGILRMVF